MTINKAPQDPIRRPRRKSSFHTFSEEQTRRLSVPMTEMKMVKNWAESYAVEESKFRRPKSLDELKELVANEESIRVAGSMHSCAPLIESPGVIISLENFNKILDIDVESKIARVEGGVVIHDLADALKPHGLALGTLGTIDWQTVTGAVMTGTHGGSLTTPSLHAFAESYKILKANGEIVKVSRSDEDPKLFRAIAPSNGVFGIIIEMAIRCVPFQFLAAKMTAMPFDELPGKFCDIMNENKYARVIVYPTLGQATIWTAKPVASKEEAIEMGAAFSDDYTNFRNGEEKGWLEEFLVHSEAKEYAKADASLEKVLASQLGRLEHYAGQYNHVLCKERNNGIPHADMEFGFEFQKAPEILGTLLDYFKSGKRAPYYNYEMRTTQMDDAILSCCHGRDTVWIDFQAKSEHMSEFFGAMEDLLAPFEYRKHWAKGMDHTAPGYLMSQYPELPEFLCYVSDFDPEGKFRNDHVDLWFKKTKRLSDTVSKTYRASGGKQKRPTFMELAAILADISDNEGEEE